MADTSVLDRPQATDAVLPQLSWSKVVVTGGFGSGKSTLIRAACPGLVLGTEEPVCSVLRRDEGWPPLEAERDSKVTMTAALDFARLDLPSRHRFYIYGTPGRMSFWSIWQDLCEGAHGAVVVADTAHLASSFAALDFFTCYGVPLVMVISTVSGNETVDEPMVRHTLGLAGSVPLLSGDLRDPAVARNVFVVLDGLMTERATPPFPTM